MPPTILRGTSYYHHHFGDKNPEGGCRLGSHRELSGRARNGLPALTQEPTLLTSTVCVCMYPSITGHTAGEWEGLNPQVFLTLKPMLLSHNLQLPEHYHWLHCPVSTSNTTNSTITINNKGCHLWRACCARTRKLWLRDVNLTQIPN